MGVQVDVTEHPTAAEATPVGMQAANAVGQALQNMNWWVSGGKGAERWKAAASQLGSRRACLVVALAGLGWAARRTLRLACRPSACAL